MSKKLLMEIDAELVEKIEWLARRYGESDKADLLARAIGFLEAADPYVDDDGTLTVLDPTKLSDNIEDDLVGLEFENAKGRTRFSKRPHTVKLGQLGGSPAAALPAN